MQSNIQWDEAKGEWVDPTAKELYPHRPVWTPDESAFACKTCMCEFSMWVRRHHCRACGGVFCHKCSSYSIELPPEMEYVGKQRVCLNCFTRITEKNKQSDTGGASDDTTEEVLTAQFFIRPLPEFAFNKVMGGIGWRKPREKCYVMLDMKLEDKKGMVLMSVTSGRFSALPLNTDIGGRFFKRMMTLIDHPNVLPVKKAEYLQEQGKAVVVRGWRSKGSLKDLVYRSYPKTQYDRKYAPGSGRGLSLKECALYGRQLLEALSYFASMQYPFPHLHCGNVLISGDKKIAAISEVENTLLGLRPRRHFVTQATPEIECFACTIYEMATGNELDLEGKSTPLDAAPKPIYEVVKCIVDPAPDNAPPSADDLLKFAIFQQVAYESPNVPPLKLKAKARGMLDQVVAALPSRLQATEEQDDEEILSPVVSPRAPQRKGSQPGVSRSAVSPRSKKRPLSKAKTTSVLPSASGAGAGSSSPATPPAAQDAQPAASAPAPAPSGGGGPPPPPPPAPPSGPPPPMPAAMAKAVPAPQAGRGDLLASIRQGKKLKKADERELPPPPSGGGGGGGDGGGGGGGGGGGPLSIADALRAKFATANKSR